MYILSPLLIQADHKIANEELRLSILSTTLTIVGSAATIAKNNKVTYLALGSEINPDPYTSADQKALDKLDYTKLEIRKSRSR